MFKIQLLTSVCCTYLTVVNFAIHYYLSSNTNWSRSIQSCSSVCQIWHLGSTTLLYLYLKPSKLCKISLWHSPGAMKVMEMFPHSPGFKGGHTTFFSRGFSFQSTGEPWNWTWVHLHSSVCRTQMHEQVVLYFSLKYRKYTSKTFIDHFIQMSINNDHKQKGK